MDLFLYIFENESIVEWSSLKRKNLTISKFELLWYSYVYQVVQLNEEATMFEQRNTIFFLLVEDD